MMIDEIRKRRENARKEWRKYKRTKHSSGSGKNLRPMDSKKMHAWNEWLKWDARLRDAEQGGSG